MTEDPQHPTQLLYENTALEEELRAASVAAFGIPLFVNRYAGNQIHIQTGPPPEPVAPPAPRELIERLRVVPHAHEQGDGFRSFMGILLTLIAGAQRILVVDEPEAFLHPPQAKLLGRKLAESVPEGRQVVAATHSSDIVVGALDAPDAKVTIVRLTRENEVNNISVLPHEQLRELWSDPLLRYSNILDGLFHRAVVICEADSDSMFFSASFDHWLSSRGHPASEVLFTHSAGKARLYKVAAALRAVDVPVRVIADIDILNSQSDLKRLLGALGAETAPLLALQAMIHADIVSRTKNPRKEYVADRLNDVLSSCPPGQPLTDPVIETLRALLRSTRGWSLLKQAGLSSLKGDTLSRCQEAITLAEAAGLLIVNGELESFDRTISDHGPEWTAEALTRGVHQNAAAQEFASRLATSLGIGESP